MPAQRKLMDPQQAPVEAPPGVVPAYQGRRRLLMQENATVSDESPAFAALQFESWVNNITRARARRVNFDTPEDYDTWFRENTPAEAQRFYGQQIGRVYTKLMPQNVMNQVVERGIDAYERRRAAPVNRQFEAGRGGGPLPPDALPPEREAWAAGQDLARQTRESEARLANIPADNARADAQLELSRQATDAQQRQAAEVSAMRADQAAERQARTQQEQLTSSQWDEYIKGKGFNVTSSTDSNGVVTVWNPFERTVKTYLRDPGVTGAGAPPPPAPQQPTAEVRPASDGLPTLSPEEAAKLPPGTRFRGADGKVRVKS